MAFLWTKLAQSVLKKAVLAVVSFLTGPQLASLFASFGVAIDPTALSTGIFAALESLRIWLTHQPWSKNLPARLLAAL